jgi:hypothetical protein
MPGANLGVILCSDDTISTLSLGLVLHVGSKDFRQSDLESGFDDLVEESLMVEFVECLGYVQKYAFRVFFPVETGYMICSSNTWSVVD